MTPSIFGNGGIPDLRVPGSEKSLNSADRVLRAFKTSYRQARYLASVARSRWFADTQRTFDQISGARAWDYSTELERERYERVQARVAGVRGNSSWGRALELGCYDGTFTQELAAHCSEVAACDVSSNACARTRSRCAHLLHVRATRLNIETDEITGIYDVVFAMDILNYVYGRDKMLKASAKIAAALNDRGLLIITDCRLAPYIRDAWFRYFVPVGAENIVRLFANRPEWRLLSAEFHPDSGEDVGSHYMAHVIALFEKRGV
jgi:2-polyprenyl-3-methyl-5-hydroxy-6-metoxy-1,4-benzoquinol methylase